MDNDAKMIQDSGNALVNLAVKYRSSILRDRMAMKPALDELVKDHALYQIKLLKEGVITTDEDLKEMDRIKKEIDKAAKLEKILIAIAKFTAFVATKI